MVEEKRLRERDKMLDITYSLDFERIWKLWLSIPQPRGRSKKGPSYKAWQSADKLLIFAQSDVDFIYNDIDARRRTDKRWLIDHGRYVPMLATYVNQRWWLEAYTKIAAERAAVVTTEAREDDALKFWQATAKRGGPLDRMPERYRSLIGVL